MSNNSDNGITGGLDTTLPIAMTISAFTAIAWYNVVELNIMIWMTFRRHSGLYFYSLLGSSWGILIYALAFLMKFFQVWTNEYVCVALITVGWYAMVTGQSLVLYSRLHLVVRDNRKIRWVLYMIIIDVFLFHFPTTVLTFGVRVLPSLQNYTYILTIATGQFTLGKLICQSILNHGKDPNDSLLHPRIYHLRPLLIRNASSLAT
jgi:hypothetical protein